MKSRDVEEIAELAAKYRPCLMPPPTFQVHLENAFREFKAAEAMLISPEAKAALRLEFSESIMKDIFDAKASG